MTDEYLEGIRNRPLSKLAGQAFAKRPAATADKPRVSDEVVAHKLLGCELAIAEGKGVLLEARVYRSILLDLRDARTTLTEVRSEVERLKPLCDGYGKLNSDYAIMKQRAEAAEARNRVLEEALRQIRDTPGDVNIQPALPMIRWIATAALSPKEEPRG